MEFELSETDIKRQICEYLSIFEECIFTMSPPRRSDYKSKFMPKGWPDISGSWKGKAFFIEIKKPKTGKLSEEQTEFILNARKQGAIAFVATNIEDVQKKLSPH